ncbi:MAG: hypothetical protein U0892_11860 [Pirellulales bacterium]
MNRRPSCLPDSPAALFIPGFSRVDLIGPDATKIANGLCTADLKKLESGKSVEAFFTDERGWVKEYVVVTRADDDLQLSGLIGDSKSLLNHLDRFVFRENVALRDRTNQVVGYLLYLTQPETDGRRLLNALIGHETAGDIEGRVSCTAGGVEMQVQPYPIALGPTCLLQVAAEDQEAAEDVLRGLGIQCVRDDNLFECVRVESVWPRVGSEIVEKVLPQELDRDQRAISFTKGCYLGQETVARLDALGQVQRKIRLLHMEPSDPTADISSWKAGAAVESDGKQVGVLTSVSVSRDGLPHALGYIRRAALNTEARLTVGSCAARVSVAH